MKNVLLLSAVLAAAAAPLFALGNVEVSGPIVRDSRMLPPFQTIKLAGSGDVVFTTGFYGVIVETNESVVDYVETEVRGGELVLKLQDGTSVWGNLQLRFLVSAPGLEGVEIAGSGSFRADDRLEGDSFSASIAGSGSIAAELDVDKFRASIAGSGRIEAEGEAEEVVIRIGGSGDVRAEDLETRKADVSVAGSGNSYLTVSDRLDVAIMGSGNVYYSGRPKIGISQAGSGRLIPRD